MKLLFDQNLSPSLRNRLRGFYPGSTHLIDVGLDLAPDTDVWPYAKDNDFVVVTKDSDYRDLGNRLGHPPKVIWIRTGNSPVAVVESLLRDHYGEIESFDQDPEQGIIELR